MTEAMIQAKQRGETAAHTIFTAGPIGVGIVGTGYAAKQRVEAFQADDRSCVLVVSGNTVEKTSRFAHQYGLEPAETWLALVQREDVDLVVVCHVNCGHGQVVRAALEAGKSVVVEYPLSLSATDAAELIALARAQRSLLHVEHIELLGSLHQTLQARLPDIGTPAYARYCTAVVQNPVPRKWTYNARLFGFPLAGALSRLHRLTNLFGAVDTVACQLQYAPDIAASPDGYFTHCRCLAQLQFHSGVMAELLYAKGDQTWRSQRWMEVTGDQGALLFDRDDGTLIFAGGDRPLEMAPRRGLFAKDTAAVLAALTEGHPLYVTPEESLYALQVAAAAAESSRTGQTIKLPLH